MTSTLLLRVRSLIELAVRRRWSEGLITRDTDGVFTSYLGAEHVEKLMGSAPATIQPQSGNHDYSPSSVLGELERALDLSGTEMDLLALLLAQETDPASARLIAYLGGNQGPPSLTFELVFEVVYRARSADYETAVALLHHDLAAHRPLRRLRYIVVDGVGTRVVLAQAIRLSSRLVSWLVGHREIDPELSAIAKLHPPWPPLGECPAEALNTAKAALTHRERLLLITGPAQSGRELVVRFAALALERPLLVVEGRGLTPDRIVAGFREASLQNAILLVRDGDDALEGEVVARFREALEVFPDTVAVIGSGKIAPVLGGMRPITTVEVAVPPHDERFRMWRTYLGDTNPLAETTLREIASLYNLGIGGIVCAASRALEMAEFANTPVSRSEIALAVRQLFHADLASVASRIEVHQNWDDLVLPDDLAQSMVEIVDRIRFRGEVLGSWGFARKLGKGLGLTVLFSGSPGTGKSMAAGLIAKQLGLDLYVVDLGRITSKWLGETEKNLGRAFDAAEAGHVLLLFDEADSILAKRSGNIQTANDRHANLETNFVLARLEQFSGIAVFTTNLPSAIDPAIARRMSIQLNFPFPDVPTRAEMWHRLLPREAPVDRAIDFAALAQRFELSGGFIRNIVLRAAYSAARDQSPIRMVHLEHAAEHEYRERGALAIGGRLA